MSIPTLFALPVSRLLLLTVRAVCVANPYNNPQAATPVGCQIALRFPEVRFWLPELNLVTNTNAKL